MVVTRSTSDNGESSTMAGITHLENSQGNAGDNLTTILLRQLKELRQRNDTLDQLVTEYRRFFGNDLTKYPEDVANHARIQQQSHATDIRRVSPTV
jgi:hypothetical protein